MVFSGSFRFFPSLAARKYQAPKALPGLQQSAVLVWFEKQLAPLRVQPRYHVALGRLRWSSEAKPRKPSKFLQAINPAITLAVRQGVVDPRRILDPRSDPRFSSCFGLPLLFIAHSWSSGTRTECLDFSYFVSGLDHFSGQKESSETFSGQSKEDTGGRPLVCFPDFMDLLKFGCFGLFWVFLKHSLSTTKGECFKRETLTILTTLGGPSPV